MPSKCDTKVCTPDKYCNPATGYCVLRRGKIGQALLAKHPPAASHPPKQTSKCDTKVCEPDKICNPATGYCVLRRGKIGQALLAKQQQQQPAAMDIDHPASPVLSDYDKMKHVIELMKSYYRVPDKDLPVLVYEITLFPDYMRALLDNTPAMQYLPYPNAAEALQQFAADLITFGTYEYGSTWLEGAKAVVKQRRAEIQARHKAEAEEKARQERLEQQRQAELEAGRLANEEMRRQVQQQRNSNRAKILRQYAQTGSFVSPGLSPEASRKMYKKLMLLFHPDKGGSDEAFLAIRRESSSRHRA